MADKKPRLVLLKNTGKAGGPEKIPVIIVPGMAMVFAGNNWKRILQNNGHIAEIAGLYTLVPTQTIDGQARALSAEIEKIIARCKATKCHLLGYSMGGITALHFLRKYNRRGRVLKCICMAAPFHGIMDYLKIFLPFGILAKGLPEIVRGSRLLADIASEETTPLAKIYTIRGEADWLCAKESCHLPFANNLPPTNGGHLAICCGLNKQAVNQVLGILAS